MTPQPTHHHSRSRTGAIVLVALATLALSACARPAVPPTGYDPPFTAPQPSTDFAVFAEQHISWAPCAKGLQCGRVFAPLDWQDPEGALITLAVVRKPAEGSGPTRGTLFVNPGGPGASGYSFLVNVDDSAISPELRQNFDLVSWDPRGVGNSSAVSCEDIESSDTGAPESQAPAEPSNHWIAEKITAGRAYGEACLKRTGSLLGYVDTASTVDDLEMLRAITGEQPLNYLGYSYGTKIGARYADRYPDHVGAMVLDGAVDPTLASGAMSVAQAAAIEQSLHAYLAECPERKGCPFPADPDQALAELNSELETAAAIPIVADDGRTLTTSALHTAIIATLYRHDTWNALDALFAELATGGGETALMFSDQYTHREGGKPKTNAEAAHRAIDCLDHDADRAASYQSMRENAQRIREVSPILGEYLEYSEALCADWPVHKHESRPSENTPVTAQGTPPILVVGTTGDPATPYEWAQELTRQLSSGVLVTNVGYGHTGYPASTCVRSAVDAYFLRGEVPQQDPTCTADD